MLFWRDDDDDAAADVGGFGDKRFEVACEARDNVVDDDEWTSDLVFGLGGGAGRSTMTFSMRILGGSTLNLLPLPPRRGMAGRLGLWVFAKRCERYVCET